MLDGRSFEAIAWLRAFIRSDKFDRVLLAGFVLVVLVGIGTSYADFRRLAEERRAGRSLADAEASIAAEMLRFVDRDAFDAAAAAPTAEMMATGQTATAAGADASPDE